MNSTGTLESSGIASGPTAQPARDGPSENSPSHVRILYGTPLSGHTHRVELLLRMLGLTYDYADTPASKRKTLEFAALNPLQQIPVLKDGDLVLADSNAILVYLAKRYAPGSAWLPEEPLAAAQVQRWLSIAAGELMYGPAIARMVAQWNFPGDLARAKVIAARLFDFMNEHLGFMNGNINCRFLAAEHPTIADLAVYSYIRHAPEGGIPLDEFPRVLEWLGRIEALPHFKAMPTSPLPHMPKSPSPPPR